MYEGCDCCDPRRRRGLDLEAIVCLVNGQAAGAHRQHNGGAKYGDPRKGEKGNDPFLIVVEDTDTQDEEKEGGWKCHYKYHVYLANITAIENWSG